MSIEAYLNKKKVTLWTSSGVDVAGDPTFNVPVEINASWEEKEDIFFDSSGAERRSRATVWLNQDVEPDVDYIFLGSSSQASPMDQVGAEIVKAFTKIPAIVGTSVERRALL